MKIYYSELFCLGKDPLQQAAALAKLPDISMELMLDGPFWNDFHLDMEHRIRQLRALPLHYAVHAPVWEVNLTCENSHLRAAALQTNLAAVDFAARLGADHLVIHPGFCNSPAFDKALARKRCQQAMEQLLLAAEPHALPLLVENVGSNASSLFTMEQYIAFCNQLPPTAGALVDVGHAHLNGWSFAALFDQLGPRLQALHLHDNDGFADSHSPIGDGTIDWPELFRQLQACGATPALILEYSPHTAIEHLLAGQRQVQLLLRTPDKKEVLL